MNDFTEHLDEEATCCAVCDICVDDVVYSGNKAAVSKQMNLDGWTERDEPGNAGLLVCPNCKETAS